MRFLLHENRILPILFTMRQFKEKDYENAYAKMVHSNRGVIHVNTWLSKGSIMIENQGCYVLRETDVSLFKTKIFLTKIELHFCLSHSLQQLISSQQE